MPQMNPMNWVALMVLFNSVFFLCMCKIHFSFKVSQTEVALEGGADSPKALSFIKEI